jgi:hypothetical protein
MKDSFYCMYCDTEHKIPTTNMEPCTHPHAKLPVKISAEPHAEQSVKPHAEPHAEPHTECCIDQYKKLLRNPYSGIIECFNESNYTLILCCDLVFLIIFLIIQFFLALFLFVCL